MDELNALDSTIRSITVGNRGCNDESFTVLNLTRFVDLEVFEVGDGSFRYVNEVHLIGLSKLERVVIGMNSFNRGMEYPDDCLNRHFYLKNCPQLRELRIGWFSFYDFMLIEIENMDRLEVIEIGELNRQSDNFRYAALELKSEILVMK